MAQAMGKHRIECVAPERGERVFPLSTSALFRPVPGLVPLAGFPMAYAMGYNVSPWRAEGTSPFHFRVPHVRTDASVQPVAQPGEILHRNLLGAKIHLRHLFERRSRIERAQIVTQRLPLVRETTADELDQLR